MYEEVVETVETDEKEIASKMSDEEVRAEALAWVNNFRGEYNLPPLATLPTGDRFSPSSCALANALVDIADRSAKLPGGSRYREYPPGVQGMVTFVRGGALQKRPIPAVIAEFIGRLDAGRYLDLDSFSRGIFG